MRKPALLFLLAAVLAASSASAASVRDSLVLERGTFIETVDSGYRSGMYRQSGLLLDDPVGDAFLLRKVDTLPIKLIRSFVYSIPQAEKVRPSYKIGKTAPIDVEKLLNRCAEIMRRQFPDIFPEAGQEHKWSKETEGYTLSRLFWHKLGRHIGGFQQDFPAPTFGCSKLFICLTCGWTSRYCVTGQEDALIQRVMTYPDRGVKPHDLFAESYALNKGNLYLTLLTCENILAKMPFRPGRGQDLMQRKLAYIRHDSAEVGDNYGAWYHFFGIALYAFLRSPGHSRFVAETESFGSFFYEGLDPQEDYFNRYGAIFGARLRKMLEDGAWWLRPEGPQDTDYLIPQIIQPL